MENPRSRPDPFVVAAFLAVVVLFGMNFVAVRFSNRELAPFWGAGLRFLAAAALLGLVTLAARIAWPRGGALAGAVVFGMLAFGANFALLYWALVGAGASVAAIVFALVPLLTLLLASALGLERLAPRALGGALLALAGIALAFREQLALEVPPLALGAIAGAALAAAGASVAVKRFPRAHPVATNAVAMAVGAAILLALSMLSREPVALPEARATWVAFLWLVGSACLGFVLLVWVISRWSASAASYTAVLSPFVTIAAAASLAGEPVTRATLLGALVVVAGGWVGAAGALTPKGAPAGARTSSGRPRRAR